MTEPTPYTRPGPPPARRRFVLARLADAVRRQDWFTVLVEVAVVVLGVVIGFQVTDWGQRRSDRAKEQVYLRQVAQDLRETERRMTQADSADAPASRALAMVVRAYRTPERPSRDSLATWIDRTLYYSPAAPVLGSLEALVSTGDLGLIRSDTLRSALPAYLERTHTSVDADRSIVEMLLRGYERVTDRVDMYEAVAATTPQAVLDSVGASRPTFPIPGGPRRTPFPFDVEEVLSDRDLYHGLLLFGTGLGNLSSSRATYRAEAESLRVLVEAEIER